MSSNSLFEVRDAFPDSAPAEARHALRSAAHDLAERGLTAAASWARELLICVPRSSSGAASALAGPSSSAGPSHAANGTPARAPAASRLFPVHSTPALGSVFLPSSPVSHLGLRSHLAPAGATPSSQIGDDSGRFPSRAPPSPLARSAYYADGDESCASPDPSQQGSAHVHFAPSQETSRLSDVGSEAGLAGHDDDDEDDYQFARAMFEQHHFERCVAWLEKRRMTGARAQFLRLYAKYLIIERRLDEEGAIVSPASVETALRQRTSDGLLVLLKELIDPTDPFLLYLKGVLLRKFNKRIEAIDCFIRSLEQFPYCWSTWLELSTALDPEGEEIIELASLLPDSFMTAFFIDHYCRRVLRLHRHSNEVARCDALLALFPDSPYILNCKAHSHYIAEDFAEAEMQWDEARALDPYCLEGVAEYSNLLFVLDKPEKLAYLTTSLVEIGRDSPDACCALANYHTMQLNNHRAVEALQRALRLDPSCLNAWILLGHAYVELRNSQAATEMYRHALDLAPHDHRAWYGLGQAYELNESPHYALHYYQKACALSPYNARMWIGQAVCYEKLGRTQHAISSYKRALSLGGQAPAEQIDLIGHIIGVYQSADEHVATEVWHRRIVDLVTASQDGPEPLPFARYAPSFLATARMLLRDAGAQTDPSEEAQGVLDLDSDAAGAADTTDGSAMEVDDSMGPPVAARAPSHKTQGPAAAMSKAAAARANVELAGEFLARIIASGSERASEAEALQKMISTLPGAGG